VNLSYHVWIPVFKGLYGVRQIPKGDWWENMWEFPRAVSETELAALVGEGKLFACGGLRHSVTHHRITLTVSHVRPIALTEKLKWVTKEELLQLPMPSPQRKALALARRAVIESLFAGI
jgi:adenine-specific DNA glycosylase